MDTLIHADIFFFITSVFVAVLIIAFVVAMCFIVPILKDMRELSRLAKDEGTKLVEDIDELRHTVRGEGSKVKSIFDFLLGLFLQRQKHRRKRIQD